jgi:predicted permease
MMAAITDDDLACRSTALSSWTFVRVRVRSWHARLIEAAVEIAGLILPVFGVIVTGWAAGFVGCVSRDLSDGLIHFAYNVAMPALLVVTIAQEPARALLAWRFLIAFGEGSLVCFALIFLATRILSGGGVAGLSMQGLAASMTNTGFVALPILHATYGPRAVLPAAIATVFVAVVMSPAQWFCRSSTRRLRAVCTSSRPNWRGTLSSIPWSFPP